MLSALPFSALSIYAAGVAATLTLNTSSATFHVASATLDSNTKNAPARVPVSNPANLFNYSLISYWGQNIAKNQFPANQQEGSLATVCQQSPQYGTIHVTGILAYSSVKNYPGIDLSNHCSFPANAWTGWPDASRGGFSLLNCASVGKDIASCQALGIKIVISVDPRDFMSLYDGNPAYPTAVAQNIWDLFLGGYSNFRPFGNSVVLDGVDLHIWNNNLDGVSDLVSALTKLMQGYYILSASPRCQFPDYIFNPTTFPHFTSNFSYIVPYFLGSPNICGFAGNNPGGFWSTLDQWNSWLNGSMFQTPPSSMPMYLGLADWPVEAWDQATTGDYISPVAFVEQDLITRLKSHSNFAGFALQDASYDSNNHPCVNDPPKSKRTYSQFLYKQLTLPLNETGKFTSDKYMCLDKVPKTTSSSMKKTTTKPVKNAETGTPTTSHANRSVTALFFLFGFLISFLF